MFCRAQEIANGGGTYVLNLSTQSLSVKTCAILAKLLSVSNAFVDIKFNDCSLPDEGMTIWLNRLQSWLDYHCYNFCTVKQYNCTKADEFALTAYCLHSEILKDMNN